MTKAKKPPVTLWHICQTRYFPESSRITHDKTLDHYRYAVGWLKKYLGREPVLADLTDANCVATMKLMVERGRSPVSANSMIGRIRALWNWCAKQRLVEKFPTYQNMKEPKRIPRAWTREEMEKLIEACSHVGGRFGKVWKADFWVALHYVIWDTAERIGAVLEIKKEWVDFKTGILFIPAEARKSCERDMAYRLHADTLAALKKIADNDSDMLFESGRTISALYAAYKLVRKLAGLPQDRQSGFHRVRRSVASHLHAAGHNATDALGHASEDITRSAYLDPSISGAVRPADVLFRPGKRSSNAAAVVAVTVPRIAARKLPRAKVCAG